MPETTTVDMSMFETYFYDVNRSMVGAGFALISRVDIKPEDCTGRPKYSHGAGRRPMYDLVTSFFYHIIGKAVIVQLIWHYGDRVLSRLDPDKADEHQKLGYWSLKFYVDYKPYSEIIPMIHRKDRGPWDEKQFEDVPLMDVPVECRGFHSTGGSSGSHQFHINMDSDRGPHPGFMLIMELVDPIVEWVNTVLPFTARSFHELQVTDFPPHYAMPGSEEEFWGRFDTTYFKLIVRRPWGST